MSWEGRRVLVTGAGGFIGSHLVEALAREGATVRAFCLYNPNGSLGWLDEASAEFRDSLEVRLGDIRDARFVEAACKEVDIVFHLAALIAIPYSYQAPESFVDTNIRGTLNVLEAVLRAGCSRLVHTSTSEVYGTPDLVPITEDHPLKGQSPYSATKIAADKMAEAYHLSREVPVVTLRPFNTYGPRQSARAVIPTILSQLLQGEREVALGSVEPRRDFTYVADTVDGFLAAGIAPNVEGQTIQLGTGKSASISDVFSIANEVCGTKASITQEGQRIRPANSEVMILESDPSRARELLGWSATVSLEKGIRKTVRWMREHLDSFDARRYSI